MTQSVQLTKEIEDSLKMISIPQTVSDEMYNRNRDKCDRDNLEPCPCCGKGIKEENRKFYIHSAFGGSMYIPIDETEYPDTWIMYVGSTCAKKINSEYIFKDE